MFVFHCQRAASTDGKLLFWTDEKNNEEIEQYDCACSVVML